LKTITGANFKFPKETPDQKTADAGNKVINVNVNVERYEIKGKDLTVDQQNQAQEAFQDTFTGRMCSQSAMSITH